jgi:hypothetical protein
MDPRIRKDDGVSDGHDPAVGWIDPSNAQPQFRSRPDTPVGFLWLKTADLIHCGA